jgi:hypothetical protein
MDHNKKGVIPNVTSLRTDVFSFYLARGMLHILIIHHVQAQTETCNFHVIWLWLMLPGNHPPSKFLYFTTAGVRCRVEAVKDALYFTSYLFASPSRSLILTLLSENWVPFKPVLGVGGVFYFIIILHVQTQIKPSLHLSCNFASEGSPFFQILLWILTRKKENAEKHKIEGLVRLSL